MPLPPLMLRSFIYQLLHALAHSHARGVAHGNLAPYRVLAKTLDAAKDQYLLKLGDFGVSKHLTDSTVRSAAVNRQNVSI